MSTRTALPANPRHFAWPRRPVLLIGIGEAIARLSNLLLLVYVSRKFGVRGVGAYALAQGISLYLLQGVDLGLRHIGARLVAEHRHGIRAIIQTVQSKRMLLALLMMVLGYCYGQIGPVPEDTRPLVRFYALSIFGYALSLDWLAWGLGRFGWLSTWRALVSLCGCAVSIFAVHLMHAPLTVLALSNALAYVFAAWLIWIMWARPLIFSKAAITEGTRVDKRAGWKGVLWLGCAMLANQALGSADLILLGAMRDSREAGLYSAAYRLLLLVTAIYYLATQAIYPHFAALPNARRTMGALWPYLWRVSVLGVLVTVFAESARSLAVSALYGSSFAPSIRLSGPLLLAITPDFAASLLMTALVAWNRPRLVFAATASAAGFNLSLNFFLIPRFGAMGAAYATPVSYCVLLCVFAAGMLRSTRQPLLMTHEKRLGVSC